MKKTVKKIVILFAVLFLFGTFFVLFVNVYMTASASSYLLSPEEATEVTEVDCILILGCLVKDDETPSDMLADRLDTGIALYKNNVSPKLLMSGDHGRTDYDEVGTMKRYAINADVPGCDVFMDHAGFSTYESLYRAKEIFGVKKIVIVTQTYHLYRALYVARSLGIEAYGVSADLRAYSGQAGRDVREVAACCKDFFTSIFKPQPTYLGETIPIDQNGDITNDKNFNSLKTKSRTDA